jgi:hypothetical protein
MTQWLRSACGCDAWFAWEPRDVVDAAHTTWAKHALPGRVKKRTTASATPVPEEMKFVKRMYIKQDMATLVATTLSS